MSFFNKYPYTDEHEINLDWILQKIENIKIRIKELEDAIHDIVVTIPNNGKLTLKRNNVIIGDFTADQATDEDINISVPENTSDLNNDSGFVVSSDLATVATTGSYNDLLNKPTIPAAQVNSDWDAVSGVAQILNKPSLATVATSGSYNDLSDTPTIPAAQVNSDWNASSGVAQILNKPSLATVATSGSYTDLSNKPTATYSALIVDYFTGYIIRYDKLRIIHLYNATDTQIPVSYQLPATDFPAQNTQVGSWCLIDNNNNYGSRYLAVDTNGILTTSGNVVRGGFTLIYNVL